MAELRASADDLELLTQSKLFALWAMRSTHPLRQIVQEDYWSDLVGFGMRRGDLIEVVTTVGGEIQHARLIVVASHARDKILRVALLQAYAPNVITGKLEAVETGEDRAVISH